MEISIVMPFYNNEAYIKEAIESITKITYPLLEIILVDDGSKDRSREIVEPFALRDSRIKLITHKENLGAPRAQKTGIRESKGDIIVIAAADDITNLNRVEEIVKVFQEDINVGIVISDAIIIDSNSIVTEKYYSVAPKITNDTIVLNQLKRNYCLGATMAIRRNSDILLKENMLNLIDDYQISLEYILNGYDIYIINKPLIKYRIHDNNLSNNHHTLYNNTISVLKEYDLESFQKTLIDKGFNLNEIYLALAIFELFRQNPSSSYNLLEKVNIDFLSKQSQFEYYFYLGVIYYKNEVLDKSFKCFIHANKLNQNEPTILNNLACLYYVNNQKEKSIRLIKESLKQFPDYVDAQRNYNNMLMDKVELKVTERILAKNIIKRKYYNL